MQSEITPTNSTSSSKSKYRKEEIPQKSNIVIRKKWEIYGFFNNGEDFISTVKFNSYEDAEKWVLSINADYIKEWYIRSIEVKDF